MNSPLVKALGVTLFHFLWEGTAIAIALALCRARPNLRYRLACAALFAMPLAFCTTLFLAMPGSVARFPVFTELHALTSTAANARAAQGATSPLLERLQEAMRWFVPFWLTGMAACYIRSLAGWLAANRLKRAGSAAKAVWQDRLSELAARLGISGVVTLLESRLVDVPVVAGFLRPVILMPAGLLTGLPAEQLEYLLLHELAHIRRFDYAVNLLQKAIEGLLFYHPAVWWVSNVLREEREHCCDEIVLSHGADPKGYATTLAALENSRLRLAMAASGGSLAGRVRRILRRPEHPRVSGAPLLSAALLALALAAAFAVFHAPARLAAQTVAAPFEKWLNEDVTYIITPAERQRFGELRTDEERERFIGQFWEVRGAALKQEHDRRTAYANAHYPAGSAPGWKTDRGRVYITFGPPDEIDSHPSGSPEDGTPWEEWVYRSLAGVGNSGKILFRDTARNGRFVMVQLPLTPYERWLNEDVPYIIAAAERDAFRQLPTDAEREHFIEQFWQRRGPDAKEAHYRRIAYANGHFPAAGWPGWKTDRGRVYIVYGPPDEIDAHPSGGAQDSLPWQAWRYRHIEGVGENVEIVFRDAGRDGLYQMAPRN